MPLGLNIVLSADGSKAVANIGMVQTAMNQLASTVKGELTQKMKMIFSAAAIEQAAQRTGQWAQQLTQTAQAMGIATEALQALNLLAMKSNTPEQAIISMFDNVDKARQEALKGNQQLLVSFQRLGVSMADLRTLGKSALFHQTMQGIGSNVSQSSLQHRQDTAGVTGDSPELYIEKAAQTMGAGGFAGFQGDQKGEGSIIPAEVVNALSKTWAELMVDLKQVATDLIPLAGFLIALARMIVNAVGGVISFFSGIWKAVEGVVTGNTDLIAAGGQIFAGLITGLISGLAKLITSVFDMLGKGLTGILSHLPGFLGGNIAKELHENTGTTKYVDQAKDWVQKKLGLNEKEVKRGEAVTDVAAVLATGGEAGIGKMAQMGASGAAKGLGKIGFESASEAMALQSRRFRTVAEGKKGLFGGQTIETKLANYEKRRMGDNEMKSVVDDMLADLNAGKPINEVEAATKLRNEAVATKYLGQVKKAAVGTRVVAGVGGLAGVASGIQNGTATQAEQKPPGPILPMSTNFASAGSGETSMMKIGGVFGSNFQSKMIALNTEMVKLLSQISTNTSGPAAGDKYTGQSGQVGGGF